MRKSYLGCKIQAHDVSFYLLLYLGFYLVTLKIVDRPLPFFEYKISAGFPSPAEDFLEFSLDLNEYLIQHPAATFIVKVEGDSMKEAGIQPGDYLIIDRSIQPTHNKIVIAALDGQLTVKRFSKINNKVYLVAANEKYAPILIQEEQDLIIWGVVTFIIHQAN
jgi:DNA polymerase V